MTYDFRWYLCVNLKFHVIKARGRAALDRKEPFHDGLKSKNCQSKGFGESSKQQFDESSK
jgi:hypothetical protein